MRRAPQRKPDPGSPGWVTERRRFLGLAGGALALAAVSPLGLRPALGAPCDPATFDPEAWLAARGQGLLATRTPQSDAPLRGVAAQTLGEWLVERGLYLAALREIVGPWPERPPLAIRVRARKHRPLYPRYKVEYQSLPSTQRYASTIGAWLFVPTAPPGPRPAIIVPHQTVLQGKDEPAGIRGGWEQAFAKYYAERGYVTLAPDAIGYGKRTRRCNRLTGFELADAMPILAANHPDMTLLGLMLFDLTRAVDFLETRAEVDPSRIGILGHSQGGFLTNFLLPLEPRLRCGVASCGAGIFRTDAVFAQRWAYFNSAYVPRFWLYRDDPEALPIDFLQIIALAAPRAHMLQTPLGDTIWTLPGVAPMPFVASEVQRVRALYGGDAERRRFRVQPRLVAERRAARGRRAARARARRLSSGRPRPGSAPHLAGSSDRSSQVRRILPQLPLQRAPVQAEPARGGRDVAAAVGEHAVDVLPLCACERRRRMFGLARCERRGRTAGKRGQDVVGVRRLVQIVGRAETDRLDRGRDAAVAVYGRRVSLPPPCHVNVR